MAWGTVTSITAGQDLTATFLNAQIGDKFNAIATTQSYTPTIGGTGWVVGNGTLQGRHFSYGNREFVAIHFVLGTTSVGGSGGLTWTLPTTPALDGLGTTIVSKGGTAYGGVCQATHSSGTLSLFALTSLFVLTGLLNGVPSAGNWTTGDIINAQVEYVV